MQNFKTEEARKNFLAALQRSRETTKNKWNKIKSEYLETPKLCLCCLSPLSFEKRKGKFCGHKCAAIFNNGKRNTLKRVVFCLNCNSEILSPVKKFCNLKCQGEYRTKVSLKKWLSGEISNTTIPRKNNCYPTIKSFSRKYILEIRNNRCELCGWNTVNVFTNRIPLELHHLDGNSSNNVLENLQVLCPNCHALTKTSKGGNRGKGRFARRKRYADGKSY